MPPAVVKSVKDLIYWQYAKIIAESAGMGKKDYGFVMNKFKQLKQGSISWNEIREYVKEREYSNECIFCGVTTNLTLEHLLPQKYHGPNVEKNLVWICKSCNSKKRCKKTLRVLCHSSRRRSSQIRGTPHSRRKILKIRLRNPKRE